MKGSYRPDYMFTPKEDEKLVFLIRQTALTNGGKVLWELIEQQLGLDFNLCFERSKDLERQRLQNLAGWSDTEILQLTDWF